MYATLFSLEVSHDLLDEVDDLVLTLKRSLRECLTCVQASLERVCQIFDLLLLRRRHHVEVVKLLEVNLAEDAFHTIFQILLVVTFLTWINLDHVVILLFFVGLGVTVALTNPDTQVVFAAFHLFLDLVIFDAVVHAALILGEILGLVDNRLILLQDEVVVELADEVARVHHDSFLQLISHLLLPNDSRCLIGVFLVDLEEIVAAVVRLLRLTLGQQDHIQGQVAQKERFLQMTLLLEQVSIVAIESESLQIHLIGQFIDS